MSGFTKRILSGSAGLLLGAVVMVAPGLAAELTIGLRVAPTSTDPHWMTSPNNWHVNAMVFEPLLRRENSGVIGPQLAERWEMKDDKTWIFYLRKNVKWHDGTPFTADDVVFTYGRAGKVPNAPTSFATYLNQIEKMEIIDPHTIRITTIEPCPVMLDRLAYVPLVSKKYGDGASTEDYNAGKSMIGTGPYKWGSWAQNDKTTLLRNDDYWGPKEPWDKVTYKMMTNDPARMAALLAGDIDVMDTVPSLEVERLKKDARVSVWSKITGKINYYSMDPGAVMESGKVTGLNGEKLEKNPFDDPKVREAMAIALDRDAAAKRLYGDTAVATTQYLPKEAIGHNPEMNRTTKGDPARAKKLMEESGWAGKVKLELTTSPALLEGAVQLSEALAQTWTRMGLTTTVTSLPYPVLIQMRNERKIPVIVGAYMNTGGGPDNFYSSFMHTREPAKGYGVLNSQFYSNKEVDVLIEKAANMVDNAERQKLYAQVTKITVSDAKMVPLWFSEAVHATKKGLKMEPRVDFQVLATNIRPVDDKAAATK